MIRTDLLRDNRGVATSLLEAVMVIAIVSIISSFAMVSAMDHVESAKRSRAESDTKMIGIAIHSFMQSTGFVPAYKLGSLRGPTDPVFLILETQGEEPGVDETLLWPDKAEDRDRLENHLLTNLPSGTGPRYPRVGEISWSRTKGWDGPYLASLPSSDPWGNRYFVTVQFLTAQGVNTALEDESIELGNGQRAAAFVISSGPNRQIETKFGQPTDSFTRGGDDIVYRIQ